MQYLAAAAPPGRAASGGPDAAVLLQEGAAAGDVLEAYCLALLLAWNTQVRQGSGAASPWPSRAQLALADADGWLSAGSSVDGSSYKGFTAALAAAGWAIDRVALLQGQARVAWGAELRAD